MFRIEQSVVLPKTPEEVFPIAADPEEQLKWDRDGLQSAEQLTPGPLRRGSRYRGTARGVGAFEYEFSEFDPPYRFAHVAPMAIGAVRHRFEFSRVPQGSRLVQSMEVDPGGVLGWLLQPLLRQMLKKRVATINAALERYVSRSSA
jgi:hypothetical protein